MVFYFLFFFSKSIPVCKLMNMHLATLASCYKATKFIKIVANQCIPGYPGRNMPTLLVYKDKDVRANWVGAIQFGGMNMTFESAFFMFFHVVLDEPQANPSFVVVC